MAFTRRQRQAKALRDISDAVQPVAGKCTIPLVSKYPDGLVELASGVLVRVLGRPMIFTAAHVVEDPIRRGGSLHCGHGVDFSDTQAMVSPNPNRAGDETSFDSLELRSRVGDRMDSAWIELSDEHAARFEADGLTFLGSAQIWTGFERPPVVLRAKSYALHGYPKDAASGDASKVRARAQFCVLPIADPSTVIGPRELALFYRRDAPAMTGDGERVEPLHPDGFSGCGVWTLHPVRLVAIWHTWDEPRGIGRATVTRALFEGMSERDPDLPRALAVKVGP